MPVPALYFSPADMDTTPLHNITPRQMSRNESQTLGTAAAFATAAKDAFLALKAHS